MVWYHGDNPSFDITVITHIMVLACVVVLARNTVLA